jgi:uncharacterized protein
MRIALLLALLLCTQAVFASEGSMLLLAVKETQEGLEGSTASLTLEIREGKGRVFLETSPLSKIDTQVSTRFAQQVACSFLNKDCTALDFIYTIQSDSPIVAGPSAGAAMAVLTVSLLDNVTLNESLAITGTINSGGIIGPVGGIKQKVSAAQKAGIVQVLVPLGESLDNDTNSSLAGVIEVATLAEAMEAFTGKPYFPEDGRQVTIDENYNRIMKDVAEQLCARAYDILNDVEANQTTLDALSKANASLRKGEYYSAASFCFSSNVQLSGLLYRSIEEHELKEKLDELEKTISSYDKNLDARALNTLPELQTYMIVKERLAEAEDIANVSSESIEEDNLAKAIREFAFSQERYYSARSWSAFFDLPGEKIDLDNERLRQFCAQKVGEAQERAQYVEAILSDGAGNNDQLRRALDDMEGGKYTLCLHRASLAKAEADVVIGSLGLKNEEQVREVTGLKLDVARRNIVREQERGLFPIAGYAYYEYSRSLMNESPGSALLFAQYSLELSNFDAYVQPVATERPVIAGSEVKASQKKGYELIFLYVMGILTGVVIAYIVFQRKY